MQDIFLHPGEFYFGDEHVKIRTLLGSCVAITLWHPLRLIGGMCHYMLPNPNKSDPLHLNGRYAEDAILMFLQEIKKFQTVPYEYQVKVFGGGNMFPSLSKPQEKNIGQRNMDVGKKLLQECGFQIHTAHIGGIGYRRIIFDISNGDVSVHHNVGLLRQFSDNSA
jgi:chemotaxis protein CheD